jgi:hypothetical protein
MDPRRPSTDPRLPGYYRRPFRSLNRERLAAATAADLPILRAALAEETALKRPRDYLVVAFVLRINELSLP